MTDQRRDPDDPHGAPRRRSLPTISDGPAAPREPAAPQGPSAQVVQTAWARLLLSGLMRAGVRRAFISPGSRSTPFTLAAEHVGLTTHTVIDERSAGFLALGYARASGQPALCICTSGSAPAHYFPAVIEACYGHVPLIILSADRPPEAMACAAPQTIDQTRLYGPHVRFFADLGAPDESPAGLRALLRKAAQAVHHAMAAPAGPVHLNAPARKPLEPAEPRSAADIAVVERAENALVAFHPHVVAGRASAPDDMIRALAQACTTAERGIIVAGPTRPMSAARDARLRAAAYQLAARVGYPILAESASGLRFPVAWAADEPEPEAAPALVDNFDLVLGNPAWRRRLAPDLIIQIGAPPTSRHFTELLAENEQCVHAVLAESDWNDPLASAELLVCADPVDTLERVLERADSSAPQAEHAPWLDLWDKASELAWQAVLEVDAERSGADGAPLGEGQAVRAAVRAMPVGAHLILGNSLPIRSVDLYTRHTDACVRVLAQRGANGIDGFISAAAGTAFAALDGRAPMGRPQATVAIIGDVAFAHDLGGLAAAARVRAPLSIVVIDNQGGRIFDHLPIAGHAAAMGDLYGRHFSTPPGCDIAAAAALYGADYQLVENVTDLGQAVARACTRSGCSIVHARVEPESAMRDRAAIDAAFARHSREHGHG